MATLNKTAIATILTTLNTHINTSGTAGSGITTNGVNAITGAMLNQAINEFVGISKILNDLNDSTFNLTTNTFDDVQDGSTFIKVTEAEKITWNGKSESGDTVTVTLSPVTTSINYLNHSSTPVTQTVVTGVTVSSATID